MIALCTKCGKNYEAGSEEQANEPGCVCRECHRAPNHMYAPIDLSEARKVCACVPFIDGAGVMETQDCIRRLIAEVKMLRELAFHTGPGEFSPEGWTWRQQCESERARYGELESECIDQSGRVAHLYRVVRLLREEVSQARIQIIREDHPDGGSVADFYSLNTHSTQADDCNYAAARAAVDDAKALTDPTI